MGYGKKAWAGLGIYVLIVEVCAPNGELLSEQMDRWRAQQPTKAIATVWVVITAAHLLRKIDRRFDPYSWLAQLRVPVLRPNNSDRFEI